MFLSNVLSEPNFFYDHKLRKLFWSELVKPTSLIELGIMGSYENNPL